jgi:hypothetical protein
LPKYRVLLNGRDVLLELDGERQRGGFYVHCCVTAADEAEAGATALAVLRRHPPFLALQAGSLGEPAQPEPAVFVDEVEKLSWWDRHPLGISTGFIFYADPDAAPLA